MRATSIEDVLRSACALLGEAGFSVVREEPAGSDPADEPATFLRDVRALRLRVHAAGAPRALLIISRPGLGEEHLAAATLWVGQVALACESVRTIAELATRSRLAEAAALTPHFRVFLREGVEELIRYLRCEGLSVYLLDADGQSLALAEHVGGTEEAAGAFGCVPVGKGLVGRVAEDGEPRCWYPEHFGDSARPIIERMGFGTGFAVALRTRSRIVGVMNAAWVARRGVTPDEQAVMEDIGTHFAAAIEAQRLTDQLRRQLGDLERAQAELISHQRMAAVGEMAAQVAHEVRTPLAVLFNAIGVLKREPPPYDRLQLMEIIKHEGERLNQIMDDLVQLAQPSAPHLEPLSVREVVDAVIASVLSDPRASSVKMEAEVPPDLPLVMGDRRLLKQAMANVVQNAVQAAPPDSRVCITAHLAGRADVVRVDVRDAGPGVHADARDRIFDPFFTTRAVGSGLGLALARRILRTHGGELSLTDPAPGRTTFTLLFPLSAVERSMALPESAL